MKDSIRRKLEKLDERFEEIGRLLSEPEVIARQNRFRDLSMEYARLGPLVDRYRGFIALEGDADTARELAMAEELRELSPRLEAEELELQRLLVPKDPLDDSNIFLEVRAGTGGDEAALFAGDLFRMYARFAETKRWEVETLSESPGEHGGYKEIISRIIGKGAYSQLKFESGTHRVQRVPATEAQGRIHTSAVTVAILPELEEVAASRAEPGGFAHRHVPLLRGRRPARQQNRLRDPSHAPAHRHRGGVPGRALAAQESLARPVAVESPAARERAREAGLATGADAQTSGRLGRPVRAHPHV